MLSGLLTPCSGRPTRIPGQDGGVGACQAFFTFFTARFTLSLPAPRPAPLCPLPAPWHSPLLPSPHPPPDLAAPRA